MNWYEPIYAYCERGVSQALWAEPFNAVSNVAFMLAALFAFLEWRRGPRFFPEGFLILVVALIGIGSFLFHSHANTWSALTDIVPIGVFMISYLIFALRRFVGAPRLVAFASLGVFLLAMAVAPLLRCGETACLNGSVSYLPALAALVIIGGVLAQRRHPAGRSLLIAAAIFAVSLTFRTIDRAVCSVLPIGTHALWHLLNATMLYVLLLSALRHAGPARRSNS